MKRLICIILCLAMMLGCTAVVSADSAPEENYFVKIGLYYGSNALHFITFYSDDGFIIAEAGRKGFTEICDLREYGKLVARDESGKVNIYDGDGSLVYSSISTSEALMSAALDPDSRIVNAAGTKYRDGFLFGSYGDTMAVVNYISLEHYLWGMISREMPYTYELEALKAQALAGRSYVVRNANRHKGGAIDFDLCTTTHCQVYGGMSAEHDSTTHACVQTAGEVVSYENKVADTVFFADSFGHTLNSEDFWGSKVDYLKGVDDPYTGVHEWQRLFTFEDIKSRVNPGYNIGDVISVYVGERNDDGSVKTLVVQGTRNTAKISKAAIMSVFNLKSIAFSIASNGYPSIGGGVIGGSSSGSMDSGSTGGVQNTNPQIYMRDADMVTSAAEGSYYVVGTDGEPIRLAAELLTVSDGNRSVSLQELMTQENLDDTDSGDTGDSENTSKGNSTVSFTDEVCDSGYVYMTGRGYGHCVGLCQTGAGNMAKQGFGYQDIIHHYYTGVDIVDMTDLGY